MNQNLSSYLFADGVRDRHVRAQRDADEQVDDQADDRAVCADGRDRHSAELAGKVADDGDVRGVEQLAQNRRGRHRNGKARDLIPERPVEHIQ